MLESLILKFLKRHLDDSEKKDKRNKGVSFELIESIIDGSKEFGEYFKIELRTI